MEITCLKYADSVFGEEYIFKGGLKGRLLPITFCFYLIQTESKNILVDVGCNECGGFVFENFIPPVKLLENCGLKCSDITDIIITHSHYDHIACIGEFSGATVYIQKDEYSNGKKYIPETFKVVLFDEEYSLTDDIKVKKIGGHSVGSSIVLIKNYVICGDECYVKKCLTDKISTGATCNLQKSLWFVNEYGKEEYIPLLFHDPENITKTYTL